MPMINTMSVMHACHLPKDLPLQSMPIIRNFASAEFSMGSIKNIVIIGAGNVGTRLAHAFTKAGCSIVQVAGWRETSVKDLADSLNTGFTLSFENLIKGQDLYLIALPHKAMADVLPQLNLGNELLVHTSGSVPMDVLAPFAENIGVFYPLQTFSSLRRVDMTAVPLLIEANRIENEASLVSLGKKLSGNVSVANSMQRQRIHIAAVFAGNFSNHMYTLARKLMIDNGFDFELLVPLIRETALKAIEMGPEAAQTGPAARNDIDIIQKHLHMLQNDPELRDIYDLLSKSINTTARNDQL